MSVELEADQVCEACGCAGEMGFIIKEGDDVADVTIFAETKAALEAELAKYIELAKQVCAGVEYNVSELTEDSKASIQLAFLISDEPIYFLSF